MSSSPIPSRPSYRLCADSIKRPAVPERRPTTIQLGIMHSFESKTSSVFRRELVDYMGDDFWCEVGEYLVASEEDIETIRSDGKKVRRMGYQRDRTKWQCEVFSGRCVSIERSLDEHWDKVEGTIYPEGYGRTLGFYTVDARENDNTPEICLLIVSLLDINCLRVDQITPKAWAQLYDDHGRGPGSAQIVIRNYEGDEEGAIFVDSCIHEFWGDRSVREKYKYFLPAAVSCVLNQVPQMTFNTIDGVTCCDGFYRVYEDAVHEELSCVILPTPLQQETVQQQLTQWLSSTLLSAEDRGGETCSRGHACDGNLKTTRVVLDRLPPTLVVTLTSQIFHTDPNAEHIFDDLDLEYVCLDRLTRISYRVVGAVFLQTDCQHPTLHWRADEGNDLPTAFNQFMGLLREGDMLGTDDAIRPLESWWGTDSTEKQYMTPSVIFYRMI